MLLVAARRQGAAAQATGKPGSAADGTPKGHAEIALKAAASRACASAGADGDAAAAAYEKCIGEGR